jgi:hypothetical protein
MDVRESRRAASVGQDSALTGGSKARRLAAALLKELVRRTFPASALENPCIPDVRNEPQKSVGWVTVKPGNPIAVLRWKLQ